MGNAKGKIARLHASAEKSVGRTYLRLDLPPAVKGPKDGYFFIETTQSNYNALYSLALAAAINRYAVAVQTEKEITADAQAKVASLIVDW